MARVVHCSLSSLNNLFYTGTSATTRACQVDHLFIDPMNEQAVNTPGMSPAQHKEKDMDTINIEDISQECTCGEPQHVAPEGFTARHRSDSPCYERPHDAAFNAVWDVIKGWDLRREPDMGYAGATGDDVCTILESLERNKTTHVDVVFDGPPDAVSGRFVECEDMSGRSLNAGTWIDRGNGLWALRIAVGS